MSYPARHGSYHSGWWDLFAEFDAMRSRLEQLLVWESARNGPTEWASRVALGETGDGWVLDAPLPGVPPEAVDIRLTERDLTIRGEAISQYADLGTAPHRFSYRIPLPGEVLADQVAATLERGVLTVRLPRSPRAASRRIPVNPDEAAGTRTSADEHPTEPLPRPSPGWTAAPGEVPRFQHASEPTTAPPYQEPPPVEYPILGQQPLMPGTEDPDQQPFFPWPNHSRSDQDHPT